MIEIRLYRRLANFHRARGCFADRGGDSIWTLCLPSYDLEEVFMSRQVTVLTLKDTLDVTNP